MIIKKKIFIFTEISKKIGGGHYERSIRLKKKLKKKFQIFFYVNKTKHQILSIIKNITYPAIIIYDFKHHEKSVLNKNKSLFFILYESNKSYNKNSISINPLNLNKGKYNGPKWSCYPEDFFKRFKKKRLKKKINLLISQGNTDANNNINKILKILIPFIDKLNLQVFVKTSKFIKITNKFKKIKKIKIIKRIKNLSSLLNKIDIAITSCGNLSHEINFFGIHTIYFTSEKREIVRAKKLEKLKFGTFVPLVYKKKLVLELMKLLRKRIKHKKNINKIKYFKQNGLSNFIRLITKISNKNE